MANLINGRAPEDIKAGLKSCTTGKTPGYGCNISCPYLNTPNCWLPVKRDALALIEHLEAELAELKLARDCSTCGEEYCDLHSYPCCACHITAPVSMSKWHPEGTKAPPWEPPQHVLEEEEKRRRREWEEFMKEDEYVNG